VLLLLLMANRFSRAIGRKGALVSPGFRKKPVGRIALVDAGANKITPGYPEPVSKLSHDIRNQLYIIIGFAELMLQEIPGKINDEQRRNLNDVLNSGRRLQELLQGICALPGGK